MLTTTSRMDLGAPVSDPKIVEIAEFFAREETALINLLEAFCEVEAAAAVRDAARLSAARSPELENLQNALEGVLVGLDCIPSLLVEHMMDAGLCPCDAPAAILWNGARLTDLLRILEAV